MKYSLIFLDDSIFTTVYLSFWSFIEKTSEKQDLKCKVCSNFQMPFLHLVRQTPLDVALDQVDIFVRSLAQADT